MVKQAKAIEHSLDSIASYQESDLSLPRDCAARHAGRLAAWLDDMLFIAEAEAPKRGRPPKNPS